MEDLVESELQEATAKLDALNARTEMTENDVIRELLEKMKAAISEEFEKTAQGMRNYHAGMQAKNKALQQEIDRSKTVNEALQKQVDSIRKRLQAMEKALGE